MPLNRVSTLLFLVIIHNIVDGFLEWVGIETENDWWECGMVHVLSASRKFSWISRTVLTRWLCCEGLHCLSAFWWLICCVWRRWTRRGMHWRRCLRVDKERLLTCWQRQAMMMVGIPRMYQVALQRTSINCCLISTCRLAQSRSASLYHFSYRVAQKTTDTVSVKKDLLLYAFKYFTENCLIFFHLKARL